MSLDLNLPAERYHEINALSASTAKHLLRSPAHYLLSKAAQTDPSLPMRFGTLVHALVLEPATVSQKFAVEPNLPSRKTKAGRDMAAEYEAANPGKMLFDLETFQRAQRTADAVMSHRIAREYFGVGAVTETTALWTETINGSMVPHKARLDCWNERLGVIADLKTAQDASPEGFAAAVRTYKYALQAAHYPHALEMVAGVLNARFLFVAVEGEPPHGVGIYELDPETVEVARQQMRRAADLFVRANHPSASATDLGYAAEVVQLKIGA
jgi:exodeoxyribonuclease VIII